jgi:hypothetical protein
MNDRAMKECSQVLVFANKQVHLYDTCILEPTVGHNYPSRISEINEEILLMVFSRTQKTQFSLKICPNFLGLTRCRT